MEVDHALIAYSEQQPERFLDQLVFPEEVPRHLHEEETPFLEECQVAECRP